MKKQIGCWVVGCILAAVLAFTALPVFGESTTEEETVYTCNGYSYVLQEDGTAKIEAGLPHYVQEVKHDPDKGYFVDENGMRLVLRLPEELDGFTVTAVASDAFGDIMYSLASRSKMRGLDVYIPNTLINLEPGVFDFGEVHSFIVEPDHPKYMTIGNALMEKDTMRLVAYGREVGQNTIIVPEGTKIIGERAFSNLSCYQTMVIHYPYLYNDSLSTSIIFGHSTYPCDCFTEVVLPDSVTKIEAGAFIGCCSLNNVVIPDGVSFLGNGAFASCISLDSVSFSKSLIEIDDYCFEYCDLKEIVLPENLEKVGNNAFYIGSKLERMHIPSGVTVMDNSTDGTGQFTVHSMDRKAVRFTVADSNPVLACVDGALINKQENKLICYFGEEGVHSYTVPEGIVSIEERAFYGCDFIKEILVPDTVTSIGNNTFGECSKLEKLMLPLGCIENLKWDIRKFNMIKEIRLSDGWTKEQMEEQEEQIDAALRKVKEWLEQRSGEAYFIVPPVLTPEEYKAWTGKITSKERKKFANCYTRIAPSSLDDMKDTKEGRKKREELLAFCPELATTELYVLKNEENGKYENINRILRQIGFTEKDYARSLKLCNLDLGTYYYVGEVETSCVYDRESELFYPLVHIINGEIRVVMEPHY